jgi:hypothetical protein
MTEPVNREDSMYDDTWKNRTPPYPRCPECGRAVVGAMMTSRSITHSDGEVYYHPNAISVYCESGDCNWDRNLCQIPSPSKE